MNSSLKFQFVWINNFFIEIISIYPKDLPEKDDQISDYRLSMFFDFLSTFEMSCAHLARGNNCGNVMYESENDILILLE